jgi:hypothetical protein
MIWLAPWSALEVIGMAVTGLGYALVYPGLGVEAVRCAPPQRPNSATGTSQQSLALVLYAN